LDHLEVVGAHCVVLADVLDIFFSVVGNYG